MNILEKIIPKSKDSNFAILQEYMRCEKGTLEHISVIAVLRRTWALVYTSIIITAWKGDTRTHSCNCSTQENMSPGVHTYHHHSLQRKDDTRLVYIGSSMPVGLYTKACHANRLLRIYWWQGVQISQKSLSCL